MDIHKLYSKHDFKEVSKPPCLATCKVTNRQPIVSPSAAIPLSPTNLTKIYLLTLHARSRAERALGSHMKIFPAAAASHHQPHWPAEPTELTPPSGSIETGSRVQAKGEEFSNCCGLPHETRMRLIEGCGRHCTVGKCQQWHNYIYRSRHVDKHIQVHILHTTLSINYMFSQSHTEYEKSLDGIYTATHCFDKGWIWVR